MPEGGPANTFYDFVGPSPVNLWSTSDEYSVLRTVSDTQAMLELPLKRPFMTTARFPLFNTGTGVDTAYGLFGWKRYPQAALSSGTTC